MVEESKRIRIAIACQGGGSHTAFTAGVLKRILKEKDDKYEIVALSGTSGGAICALLAWYGLLANDRQKAIGLLDSFWDEISASSFGDMLLNQWIVWTSRLQGLLPIPSVSPYSYPPLAQRYLRGLLEKHVEFDNIKTSIHPSSPDLLVGAVDVFSGDFRVFKNAEISADTILASAAVPTFFQAVRMDGNVYWDGLFSQNPPIRDFVKGRGADAKPDQIWIIQINPQKRREEPKSVKEIDDRRNELSGNLSLNQEVYFIEKVNEWIEDLPDEYRSKYKPIKIKRIEMPDEYLDIASKMDRSQLFIHHLKDSGEKEAEKFLTKLSGSSPQM